MGCVALFIMATILLSVGMFLGTLLILLYYQF